MHTVIAKYKENKATTAANRSGRPCTLTERDKRQLNQIVKSDCKQPINIIRENLTKSSGTVVSKSGSYVIWGRIAAHKPLLISKNIKDRLAWAKEKRDDCVER